MKKKEKNYSGLSERHVTLSHFHQCYSARQYAMSVVLLKRNKLLKLR